MQDRTTIGFRLGFEDQKSTSASYATVQEQELNPYVKHLIKAFHDFLKEDLNEEYGGVAPRIERFHERVKAANLLCADDKKELKALRPQIIF